MKLWDANRIYIIRNSRVSIINHKKMEHIYLKFDQMEVIFES